MLAAWEEYARGAADAAVRRLPGVAAASSPCGPERAFYNNALLERDLGAAERAPTPRGDKEAAYTAGGVTRFAAWVHESDAAHEGDLERRGYTLAGDDAGNGHGARRHPACRDSESSSRRRTGATAAPSGFRRASSRAPTYPQVPRPGRALSMARTSPSRWRSISAPIADLQRRHPGARPAARPGHGPYAIACTMRATRMRTASVNRPRWPRACTPPWASGSGPVSRLGPPGAAAAGYPFRAPRSGFPMPVREGLGGSSAMSLGHGMVSAGRTVGVAAPRRGSPPAWASASS